MIGFGDRLGGRKSTNSRGMRLDSSNLRRALARRDGECEMVLTDLRLLRRRERARERERERDRVWASESELEEEDDDEDDEDEDRPRAHFVTARSTM